MRFQVKNKIYKPAHCMCVSIERIPRLITRFTNQHITYVNVCLNWMRPRLIIRFANHQITSVPQLNASQDNNKIYQWSNYKCASIECAPRFRINSSPCSLIFIFCVCSIRQNATQSHLVWPDVFWKNDQNVFNKNTIWEIIVYLEKFEDLTKKETKCRPYIF
jgi:hypothetical protein